MQEIKTEQKQEGATLRKYIHYQDGDRVLIKMYEYCGCTNPWKFVREYYQDTPVE